MILYLRGHDLWRYPETARKMFQDRAVQFGVRRGWDVHIDSTGCETDQYDPEDPIYVISCSKTNPHQGSMRLMPMLGRTMIREHFSETLPKAVQFAHDIWECTRFCVVDDAPRQTASALFAAGGAYMAHREIRQMIAVFDEKVRRLYTALDLGPVIIGAHRYGDEIYYAGGWSMDAARLTALMTSTGLTRAEIAQAISVVERQHHYRKIAA